METEKENELLKYLGLMTIAQSIQKGPPSVSEIKKSMADLKNITGLSEEEIEEAYTFLLQQSLKKGFQKRKSVGFGFKIQHGKS